jgi:tetratricopeptide (TPR) repeat protein
MSTGDFTPHENEPAVTQPDLAAIIEMVRADRVPTVRIDADALVRAVATRRAARVRRLAIGCVAAVAAAWLMWTAIDRRAWFQGEDSALDEAPRVHDGTRSGGEARESDPQRATVVDAKLDDATVVEPIIDPTLGAAELARLAERAMAERRRDDAIDLLATLVEHHPQAAEAKTALLDLGRLLRDADRPDEARCAYRLLVQRWPAESRTPELARVLASLGDGPRCRGLVPQR